MTNPIDAIATRLDGGRLWLQGDLGDYEDPQARVCIQGACMATSANSLRLRRWIEKVVGEQYPDRAFVEFTDDMPYAPAFNDHPDTTWLDVERVLEKTALIYEEGVEPEIAKIPLKYRITPSDPWTES